MGHRLLPGLLLCALGSSFWGRGQWWVEGQVAGLVLAELRAEGDGLSLQAQTRGRAGRGRLCEYSPAELEVLPSS